MKSSPSLDQPQVFRRSCTPESPRPLHIPEPANIPVLENQIDPIFNLMSTHLSPPYASRNMTAMDHEMAQLAASQEVPNGNEDGKDKSLVNRGGDSGEDAMEGQADYSTLEAEAKQDQSESSVNHNQTSSLADGHAASMASFDVLHSSMTNLQPNPPTLSSVQDSSQNATEPFEPLQNPSVISGQNATTAGPATELGEGTAHPQGAEDVTDSAVNYQDLLDRIIPLNNVEGPDANTLFGYPTPSAENIDIPAPSSANLPSSSFNAPAGLPPRPPPQEKPAIHPNYVPGEDIRSYHYPHIHHTNAHNAHSSSTSNSYRPSQYPPNLASPTVPITGSNGLPPPPMASFQQPKKGPEQQERSPTNQQQRGGDASARNSARSVVAGSRDDDAPWPPEIQRKFDQFLKDEEVYTKEGTWDKFPQGSRLFVGNLPTEVVTKRDIFHIFHRFGRLAQISIKQAYGFVQFMDTNACMTALQAEQGGKIKDRNMHLEISKPPKNARNAATSTAGDNLRASHYRRSQSPTHGRRGQGQRNAGDRFNRNVPFSDFRDEPRRRDDYRPGRSPSPPRQFRGRDEYRGSRDRSPNRFYGARRERSRSPYGRGGRHNRSPSPRRRSVDEDDALPLKRRDPRDVPDVQLILVDDLDRPFVEYVEKAFRDCGLRVAVLMMANVSLAALVRRQILEGVEAVVKLYRASRLSGKIPLQVFDRTNGANNVHFEEYDELDVQIAAQLVVRSKQKQVAAIAQNQFSGNPPAFGAPQYGQPAPQQLQQQQQQPPAAGQPNIANLITSLDGPALQQLLSVMQQSPQTPQQGSLQSPTQAPDLSALLGTINRQQAPAQAAPQNFPYPAQQPQQAQQAQFPYGVYQQAPSQYPQQQQPPQQHVQSIMEQIANWKQQSLQ